MSTEPNTLPIVPMFPRSAKYHPGWIKSSASGGANSLWLTEWLAEALALREGMRVLDLGCGRAASSIFLHREYGVQVWAADLWFCPTENRRRIEDAGAASGVFPMRLDARTLPFPAEFFDAVVGIDSFHYFGTDDHFLASILRVIKPGGILGIATAGLTGELDETPPEHLRAWWTPDLGSLHSAAWWRRHWMRTGFVDVTTADTLQDGWRRWLDWHRFVAPDNRVEMDAVEADQGRHLGFVRAVARRRPGLVLPDGIPSIPGDYHFHPLLSPTENAGRGI